MAIESPRIVAGPTVQRRHALSQPITVSDGSTAAEYEGQVYFSYDLITTTGGVSRSYGMYVAVNANDGSILDGGDFTADSTLGSDSIIDGGNFTTNSSLGNGEIIDGGDFIAGTSQAGDGSFLKWVRVDIATYQDRYTGEAVDPMTFGLNTAGVN